jgi:hypothetical protein
MIEYCPSSGELYDFDLRRLVLSIIWGALWCWPERARTIHHLGISIMLIWEDTYCPWSGDLYDFDLRRHVLVRAFSSQSHSAPQMMDSTCLLRSKSYCSPDDGRYVSSHVKIIIYDFVLRRHVLYSICGALWFWPENTRSVHHLESSMILTWEGTYCPSFGELGQYVPSQVKII